MYLYVYVIILFLSIWHFAEFSYTTDQENFCGGVLEGFSGYLKSPWYPNNYGQNLSCVWLVATNQGYRIQFQCHEFQLQPRGADSKCKDQFQMKDMVTERIIFQNCGSLSPFDVESDSHEVITYFYTDDVEQYKGFVFTWAAEEDSNSPKYISTETSEKRLDRERNEKDMTKTPERGLTNDIITPVLIAVTFIGIVCVCLFLYILKRILGRMTHSQEDVKQTLEVIKCINTGTYTHLDPDLRRTAREYTSPTNIADNVGTGEETIYMEFESQL